MTQYGIFQCECEAQWPDEIAEWDEDYQQRCPNCAYDVDEPPKLLHVLVPLGGSGEEATSAER